MEIEIYLIVIVLIVSYFYLRNTIEGFAGPYEKTVGYFGNGVCPKGWKNEGTAGILSSYENVAPLPKGGQYNGSWTWVHPVICSGKKSSGNVDKMWKFSADTTEGSNNFSVGIITPHGTQTPFSPGGGLNSGWTWTHPNLVSANTEGGYYLQPRGGNSITIGLLGKSDSKAFGTMGGGLNSGWNWHHPTLNYDA